MKNTEEALKWIVGALEKKKVPFQITGGFAAKIYGSKRPLNDIDIDIPDKYFSEITEEVKEFIVYGPAHYIDERWDCLLMTLNFNEQKIDISGSDNMRICDARTGKWVQTPTDFSTSIRKEIYGISISVIPPEDLIAYKSMLAGEHQKEDIAAASAYVQH